MELPTSTERARIDQSYENMFKNLDPEVAQRLKQKYDADAKEFDQAVEDFDPSQGKKAYWAKNSCKRCYGRGIIGTRYVFRPDEPAISDGLRGYSNAAFTLPQECRCGDRAYYKWVANFRKFFNALKEQSEVEGVSNDS